MTAADEQAREIAGRLTKAQREVILKLTRTPRKAIDFSGTAAADLRLPTSKRPALTDRNMARNHGRKTAWYFLNADGFRVQAALREMQGETK